MLYYLWVYTFEASIFDPSALRHKIQYLAIMSPHTLSDSPFLQDDI